MDKLLIRLKKDYPGLVFASGAVFLWSPAQQTVLYVPATPEDTRAAWSLLHEVGHALLRHASYHSDLELLKLEANAWERAAEIAKNYSINIDRDHIQDCLDTYRDWVHQRSTCPTCNTISLQASPTTYRCHNCQSSWRVSRSRFCRPYRQALPTG